MFHYFHGGSHGKGQGSLSAEEFGAILDFASPRGFVSPEEWCQRVDTDSLNGAVCLTFDDGLRSQYDVALPILEERGLAAFFFVHTSVLADPPVGPELHRYLRSTYDDLDQFYSEFFEAVALTEYGKRVSEALNTFTPDSYLTAYPFYTEADKRFRLVRDDVLTFSEFDAVMGVMFADKNIDREAVARTLWLQRDHLRDLERRGHIVGLHSHSHPMKLERLSYEEQLHEYQTNSDMLAETLGRRPVCMSHPANSRNAATFQVLTKLGVQVGFRAVMGGPDWTKLDLPREDSTNVLAEMSRENHSSHR